mmetsp:Transcript_57554/g.171630  ORF Transcript_57554/g.171630 Transcript_57554/m.171630 type:complete len:85 (+) Transcript_57554:558-812(+)
MRGAKGIDTVAVGAGAGAGISSSGGVQTPPNGEKSSGVAASVGGKRYTVAGPRSPVPGPGPGRSPKDVSTSGRGSQNVPIAPKE